RRAESLRRQRRARAHQPCPPPGPKLPREEGSARPLPARHFPGPPRPARARQFRYLQGQLDLFRDRGWPVISVDAKKSELIGNFKNAGAAWCWHPEEVNCHDFLADAACRAIPYGVYDVLANRGFVRVGLSANTPAFAAASVRA